MGLNKKDIEAVRFDLGFPIFSIMSVNTFSASGWFRISVQLNVGSLVIIRSD